MIKAPTQKKFNSCRTCSFRDRSIFSGLDYTHLLELENMQQKLAYPEGVVLFLRGEEPRGVYCVCSGRIKLSTNSPDGRALVLGYVLPGNVLGIRAVLSDKTHDLTARTVEKSQLSFIDKNDFLGFLKRNGNVCLSLAETLSDELSELYEGYSNIALSSSYKRVASLLLRLCDSYGESSPKGIIINLKLSQEDMAEMAGMSRRTLSRAIQELKRKGVIECDRLVTIIKDKSTLDNLIT